MKKNILIAGSSGFIGKNLVEYFSSKVHVFAPSHAELELLDDNKVYDYIIRHNINIIIHAASVGGLRGRAENKEEVYFNLRIFFNLIKNFSRVQKIIFFGSGAEYDKSRPLVNISETDFGVNIPEDSYGFYKYVCSKYLEGISVTRIINLRLFGVYGKYENYFYRFISNAIVKNLLHLAIDINQNVYFDYLYIDDLMKIVDYFIKNETKSNIYNTSSASRSDLITIAQRINQISTYQSPIIVRKKGFNNEYTASNDRLKREKKDLRFTSLDAGIRSLYHWYKKRLNSVPIDKIRQQQTDLTGTEGL